MPLRTGLQIVAIFRYIHLYRRDNTGMFIGHMQRHSVQEENEITTGHPFLLLNYWPTAAPNTQCCCVKSEYSAT